MPCEHHPLHPASMFNIYRNPNLPVHPLHCAPGLQSTFPSASTVKSTDWDLRDYYPATNPLLLVRFPGLPQWRRPDPKPLPAGTVVALTFGSKIEPFLCWWRFFFFRMADDDDDFTINGAQSTHLPHDSRHSLTHECEECAPRIGAAQVTWLPWRGAREDGEGLKCGQIPSIFVIQQVNWHPSAIGLNANV